MKLKCIFNVNSISPREHKCNLNQIQRFFCEETYLEVLFVKCWPNIWQGMTTNLGFAESEKVRGGRGKIHWWPQWQYAQKPQSVIKLCTLTCRPYGLVTWFSHATLLLFACVRVTQNLNVHVYLAAQLNYVTLEPKLLCLWLSAFHMMTSSNGYIFRLTGHLRGEFTGHRWIPHTKASDA